MIKVGIVGGTGYTGVECIRLLLGHPEVSIHAVTSRGEAGRSVSEVFPSMRGCLDIPFQAPEHEVLAECDVVFFATPNGTAMRQTPALLEAGVKVIDLAADFRLRDAEVWAQWYGEPHACPELLEEAVYGLPELNRTAISQARLVANPGCYPTATTLGFLPLIESGLIAEQTLIADCKSGVTGAGRQAALRLNYSEVNESFSAYGASGHRHHPEISQNLASIAQLSEQPAPGLVFTPHLVPMQRGIHATLYAKPSKTLPLAELQTLFEARYADEPAVDVLPTGQHPLTASVRGINVCRIALHYAADAEHVVILSVIDNLVKGAAGQALQNMNLMFGFDERAGLQAAALQP